MDRNFLIGLVVRYLLSEYIFLIKQLAFLRYTPKESLYQIPGYYFFSLSLETNNHAFIRVNKIKKIHHWQRLVGLEKLPSPFYAIALGLMLYKNNVFN